MSLSAYQFWREMDLFKEAKLNRLPRVWRDAVRKKYSALCKGSVRDANLYLVDLIEPLEGAIDIGAGDDDLQELAKQCAAKCRENFALSLTFGEGFNHEPWDKALTLCNSYNVRYPIEHDLNQQKARLTDAGFWLRNLRNSHAKARESAAREAGIVHKKHDMYVSDDTVERRAQQLRRNAELLANVELRSEHGEIMKLSDIANAGMANKENRRNELVTRLTGFEQLANKYAHKSMFLTLTTPSRMHKMTVTKSGQVIENKKYDGTTPDEAQKYLVHCWAKARALLAKHDVKFYGLRVAEPHHDGTPHWHMVLFYGGKKSTKAKLKWHISRKFIETDRDELHADISPRFKAIDIDEKKGSAVGYVLKYILKNLGGINGANGDEGGGDSVSLYERVEAWAATWRIRQFQQIGGHSVTTWRELRRVDEVQLIDKKPRFLEAWRACQRRGEVLASFADYIEAMGGLNTPPRESFYRVDYDVIAHQGKYGECLKFKVLGVGERLGFEVVATNRAEWVRV